MELNYQKALSINNMLVNSKPSAPIPLKWVLWKSKIINALSNTMKELKEASTFDEKWKGESDQRRKELLQLEKKYTSKDKDGNPIIIDQTSFELEKIEIIEVNYSDLNAEEKRVNKEYKEILKEKVKIDLPKIKESDLPENWDSPPQFELIIDLIESE